MIDRISIPPGGLAPSASSAPKIESGTDLGRRFSELLNQAISQIEADERQLDEWNKKVLAGDLTAIDQMLIAGEKASLHLELTVQIRNKVIEAYQEIMRMQI